MKTLIAVGCTLVLAGCAGPGVPPSKLVGPAASLMVSPQRLPTISEGDDIVQHAAMVRKMYSKEANKLRRLQRYVRTANK